MFTAYSMSKAALNMFTKNVALDWKNDNIRCTSIHPGWVKTDMGTSAATLTITLSPRMSLTSSCLLFPFLFVMIYSAELEAHAVVVSDENAVTTQHQSVSDEFCEMRNSEISLLINICQICNDMVSDRQPNARANCKSNCFNNAHFRSCLRLFVPHRYPQGTRHR